MRRAEPQHPKHTPMSRRTKPKNSEETPVAPDASSATQNITADQAGTSSDHEAQHTAEPSSDNPGEGASPQQADEKPQNRGAGSKNVKEVPTDKLKPHPLSTKIYTPQISGALLTSIQDHGILLPLMVNPNTYEIISGNSRHAAAKQLGIPKVPVIFFTSSDELEIRQAVLETNSQRDKNKEQKIREYLEWLDIEKEAGKRRMATNSQKEGVYNGTQGEAGKSRDKAAVKIGMSGLHAERGGQVVTAIDALIAKGKSGEATELSAKLNHSINAAYNLAVKSGFIVKAKRTTSKPKAPTTNPPKSAKETATATSVTKIESSEAAAVAEAEHKATDAEFTVSSHAEAIAGLDAITVFAAQVKPGPHIKFYRSKWVDSVNALTKALAAVGLIIHNVDANA